MRSSGARSVRLPERLEHVRQELWLDPDPRIAHGDLHVRALTAQRYLDSSALRRELDRIAHQIPDDLLQAIRIPHELPDFRSEGHWLAESDGGDDIYGAALDKALKAITARKR